MVAPRAVHQDERITDISNDLRVDPDAIDLTGGHEDPPSAIAGIVGRPSGVRRLRSAAARCGLIASVSQLPLVAPASPRRHVRTPAREREPYSGRFGSQIEVSSG
jgi:hypothetical protein